MGQKGKPEIVCRCNEVARDIIEKAIRENKIQNLDEIYDLTMAGIGACGGSCRVILVKMLEEFKETGKFPEKLPPRQKK